MGKIKNSIYKNYSKCWKFANETKWFFVFSLGIFVFTFLIGFTFPIFFKKEILNLLKILITNIKGKNTFELISYIFLNNLKASFMAIILGIFFGVFPLITCIANGYLLGFVARKAVETGGILMMWKIFPHGIFELPAVLFSIGIGLRIGLSSITGQIWNNEEQGVKHIFIEGLRFFVFVVFPLLVIAATIEGTLIILGI